MYWAWRVIAAFRYRGSGGRKATAAPVANAPVPARTQTEQFAPPNEDIAVIAAAVYARLGTHRIVHLDAAPSGRAWEIEGRWAQQTSHTPAKASIPRSRNMKKNFRITVDGRSYNVVVEDLNAAAEPHVLATVPAAAVAAPARVAAPVPPTAPAPPAAPAPAGSGAIVAPLGGVVVSIDVALGRDVAVGDKVATIEAMKMKTHVLSKVAGKISNIAAKANESVETGQVLMTVG